VDAVIERCGVKSGTGQAGLRPEALVADDDGLVCDTVARMLECLGYRVHKVADGGAAVRDVESSDGSLKVVVMDVVMPGMDGLEASRRIHDLCPQIPVILASGTYDFAHTATDKAYGAAFLRKPFSMGALSKALAAAGC
jgi:CheY-like chemotaxis protein